VFKCLKAMGRSIDQSIASAWMLINRIQADVASIAISTGGGG
jgi:hypothetical protein